MFAQQQHKPCQTNTSCVSCVCGYCCNKVNPNSNNPCYPSSQQTHTTSVYRHNSRGLVVRRPTTCACWWNIIAAGCATWCCPLNWYGPCESFPIAKILLQDAHTSSLEDCCRSNATVKTLLELSLHFSITHTHAAKRFP